MPKLALALALGLSPLALAAPALRTAPLEPPAPLEIELQGPLLGVQVHSMAQHHRERLGVDPSVGVWVSGVLPDSPAEAAGLRRGDVLIELDEQPVQDIWTLRQVVHQAAGEQVPLRLVREGRLHTVQTRLPATAWELAGTGRQAFVARVAALEAGESWLGPYAGRGGCGLEAGPWVDMFRSAWARLTDGSCARH